MSQLTDQDQTRMALAALFASLVKALDESEGGVSQRFQRNLELLYTGMKEYEDQPLAVLEVLTWTSDLMRRLKS